MFLHFPFKMQKSTIMKSKKLHKFSTSTNPDTGFQAFTYKSTIQSFSQCIQENFIKTCNIHNANKTTVKVCPHTHTKRQ